MSRFAQELRKRLRIRRVDSDKVACVTFEGNLFMRTQLLLLGAVGANLLLAGCSTPVTETPAYIPNIITLEQTVDPVHQRDVSAEFYTDNRGGAAVRQEEVAQVLHNEHYAADPVALEEKRMAELKAAWEKEQDLKAEKERKAKEEALRQEKLKADAEAEAAKAQNRIKKDKSIYSNKKDRSIYSDKKK